MMLVKISRRLELTSATRSGLLTKGWSLIASPLTLIILLARLSAAEQGYYYSFIGAAAFQSLAELGLGSVLTQIVARVRGAIIADSGCSETERIARIDRLSSAALRSAIKWYLGIGAVGFIIVLSFGRAIFNAPGSAKYLFPFAIYAFTSVANLMFTPAFAILSGVGRYNQVAKFDFAKQALSSIALWVALWIRAGVDALIWQQSAILVVNFAFFARERIARRPGMRRITDRKSVAADINWRRDVLPLQTKVAAMAALGTVATNISSPLLLRIFGPAVSGRFGITQNVVASLGACASVWYIARLPDLAHAVGARSGELFKDLNYKLERICLAAFTVGSLAGIAILLSLRTIKPVLAMRFLDPGLFVLVLIDGALLQLCTLRIYGARCFGQEYFLPMSFALAALSIAFPLCAGPLMAFNAYAIAYFIARYLIIIPSLWIRGGRLLGDIAKLSC